MYLTSFCKEFDDKHDSNEYKVLTVGFTSTVYKELRNRSSPDFQSPDPKGSKNYVIKEVYLPDDISKIQKRMNEVELNIRLKTIASKNPELKAMIVPFKGYAVCKNRLYMKFEYIPGTLASKIDGMTRSQLQNVIKQVKQKLPILHKYTTHGDLSLDNIFLRTVSPKDPKGSKKYTVLFGDWGASKPLNAKNKRADFTKFEKSIKTYLLTKQYFRTLRFRPKRVFQTQSSETKTEGSKDDIEAKILDSLYQQFEKDGNLEKFNEFSNREMKWIYENFSYRPPEFWERIATKQQKYVAMKFIDLTYGDKFWKVPGPKRSKAYISKPK